MQQCSLTSKRHVTLSSLLKNIYSIGLSAFHRYYCTQIAVLPSVLQRTVEILYLGVEAFNSSPLYSHPKKSCSLYHCWNSSWGERKYLGNNLITYKNKKIFLFTITSSKYFRKWYKLLISIQVALARQVFKRSAQLAILMKVHINTK